MPDGSTPIDARTRILDAAEAIVRARGVSGLTLDAGDGTGVLRVEAGDLRGDDEWHRGHRQDPSPRAEESPDEVEAVDRVA